MIPSTPRRSPVYTGNGVVSSFAFEFKVFAASDVEVSRVDLLGNTSVLALGADYTVTLNPDQDNYPGGTVNTTAPLASGFKLVTTGNLPYQQSTQLPNGGNYNARVVEQALDKIVVQVQQLKEASDRTLRLSVGVDGTSSALPAPVPLSVIGWDNTGLLLRNFTPGDIGVNVSYAQWQTELFSGTGVQTSFVLAVDAGSASNIDLRVNNVPQTPNVNFSYTQSTRTITFLTGAPAAGTNNVVARYGQALPQGTFVLADGSVTGAKLADGSVTGAKLADGSVSAAKIVDKAVTLAKFQDIATGSFLGRSTAGAGAPEVLTGAQAAALIPGRAPIQPISASVASNALTLTLNPTTLDFRSTTLGSGAVNTRTVSSPINLVISSGSTLGTTNGALARIAVLAIDNAGTVELAAVNLAGGVNLNEEGLISTTAEGGAGGADSASTVYSTTARTNVPYRLVGFVEITQATAGTWATAPSLVHASDPLAKWLSGYGQTWQNVLASRAHATTYTNTTGRPIKVNAQLFQTAGANVGATSTIGGVAGPGGSATYASGAFSAISFDVPPGATYSISITGFSSLSTWVELR